MEIAVRGQAGEITLGPVPFNWQPQRWRDFYLRIADEAPVASVYLGETVCSKRAPLFEPYHDVVVDRLSAAGKTVVFSTLAEVVQKADRKLVEKVTAARECLVEANDASALIHLSGRAHHIGPFMNVYNERTVGVLARDGACNICLPAEMPAAAIRALCEGAKDLDVTVEVQVFGRVSLALSARCYHARAHGRTKDSCRYVCEEDPDGMELTTLEGRPFLAVNGVQTLSYECLNLVNELPALGAMGVSRFRLSPHTCDMVEVASVFRAVLDRRIALDEAAAQLEEIRPSVPFANGFFHGGPGHRWVQPTAQ